MTVTFKVKKNTSKVYEANESHNTLLAFSVSRVCRLVGSASIWWSCERVWVLALVGYGLIKLVE